MRPLVFVLTAASVTAVFLSLVVAGLTVSATRQVSHPAMSMLAN